MIGVLRETENMPVRGRMDFPLSLFVAAARGDDILLPLLLRRGLDENESEENRRTVLVCDFPIWLQAYVTSPKAICGLEDVN